MNKQIFFVKIIIKQTIDQFSLFYSLFKREVKLLNYKQLTYRTLEEMVRRNPVKKITVEMIIREVGMAKATFYRMFKDKYDLIGQYYADCVFRIPNEGVSSSWIDAQKYICNNLYRDRELHAQLLKTEGQNSCAEYLFQAEKEYIVNGYLKYSGKETLSYIEESTIEFYIAGHIRMVETWILKKHSVTPEQFVDALCSLVPVLLRGYIGLSDDRTCRTMQTGADCEEHAFPTE